MAGARLTNVEAQRMMAVMDEAVAKFATNTLISDYLLDTFEVQDIASELATHLKCLREARGILRINAVRVFSRVVGVEALCLFCASQSTTQDDELGADLVRRSGLEAIREMQARFNRCCGLLCCCTVIALIL
jgi:hypothetical protein